MLLLLWKSSAPIYFQKFVSRDVENNSKLRMQVLKFANNWAVVHQIQRNLYNKIAETRTPNYYGADHNTSCSNSNNLELLSESY